MKIALLQAQQNELYDFGNPNRRFQLGEARRLQTEMVEQTFGLMEQAKGCDLIVTTEGINFAGGSEYVDGEYADLVPEMTDPLVSRLGDQARKMKAYLVASLYTRREGRLYSTAFVFDRMGKLASQYDKVHLAGEEQHYLTAGSAFQTIETDFGRFGVCVCWDMQFPEVCRALALMGAGLVVCPTWGWEGIYAHARAYENGIFVAGAMSVPYRASIEGIRNPSEVVGPQGSVLVAGDRQRSGVIIAHLALEAVKPHRALRLGDRRPEAYRNLVADQMDTGKEQTGG